MEWRKSPLFLLFQQNCDLLSAGNQSVDSNGQGRSAGHQPYWPRARHDSRCSCRAAVVASCSVAYLVRYIIVRRFNHNYQCDIFIALTFIAVFEAASNSSVCFADMRRGLWVLRNSAGLSATTFASRSLHNRFSSIFWATRV